MARVLEHAVTAALGTRLEALLECTALDVMIFTLSASMSAPSLCSALAIADSSSLRMSAAPFFGVKARMLIA